MNLTHKFLLWPPLRIWERRAALKRDSWPDLCMALGWPPAGGRGTWLGGTRSEMWRSCRQRHTEACEEFRCIPCCTPYPDPPAGTAEVRKHGMSKEQSFFGSWWTLHRNIWFYTTKGEILKGFIKCRVGACRGKSRLVWQKVSLWQVSIAKGIQIVNFVSKLL